ncbi:MAG TPA: presqualene diphosphate synthase HpnD, partial [Sphingomonadaceae bacterium]|nr:presqualene diphosphate synthase HpnD [Sphingomonadaceae bacterium]
MTGVGAPAASGSSFYAGMRVLPKPEREAMFAIYGFCRAVDDIADDQTSERGERRAALDRWRADLDALYGGGDEPADLAAAITRFGLEKADFLAIVDGMAMDVAADVRWPSLATLDLYCDRVASAVGRLAVRVFGMAPAPGTALAHELGRALQLTNILRDIDEDAAIGRVYLPCDYLEAAGIVPESPAQVVADPRLDHACRRLAADALGHFERADAILARRPAGHLLAPRLMAAVYAP